MKKLTKFLAVCAITMMMFTSCNTDPNEVTKITDFGTIINRTADLEYIIQTDSNNKIYSFKTLISVTEDNVGDRVLVYFDVIREGSESVDALVEILSMSIIDNVDVLYQSEVDKDTEFEKGATGLEYKNIQYKNGKMNFEFLTLSKDGNATGTPQLIYDDINSTDTIKKFNWYYLTSPSADNIVQSYFTANTDIFIRGTKYDVEINYKSLEGMEKVAKFYIDLTSNEEK